MGPTILDDCASRVHLTLTFQETGKMASCEKASHIFLTFAMEIHKAQSCDVNIFADLSNTYLTTMHGSPTTVAEIVVPAFM